MEVKARKKLVFLVTEDWYFCSHRLSLAIDSINAGFDVFVLTQAGDCSELIQKNNIQIVPIKFSRSIRHSWRNIFTLFQIYRAYNQIKPDIVHHVALQPVFYGTFVCFLMLGKQPKVIINAVTGLGSLFISNRIGLVILKQVTQYILKLLLKHPNAHLIVQNDDDANLFMKGFGVRKKVISKISGSGVDIERFKPMKRTRNKEKKVVILVARMLMDKGVNEFVCAARALKNKNIDARFILVGRLDPDNPSAITRESLYHWEQEGAIEWWDKCDNMPVVYQQADIVVLPSYREGLPKVLLEASACGLPIVTTDVPGCREVVQNGVNGFLVPAKESHSLSIVIEKLLMNQGLRDEMGKTGRKLVENKFSSDLINSQFINLYHNLISKNVEII